MAVLWKEQLEHMSGGWFRCLCTIIGFIEVDAFEAYCYFNRHACNSTKASRIWLSFCCLIDMMEPCGGDRTCSCITKETIGTQG